MKKKKRTVRRLPSKARRSGHRKPKRGYQKTVQRSGRRRLPFRAPTTARQYYAMSPKDQETWDSVAHVITRVRNGISLSKASEEFAIESSIVVELARPALRKSNRHYVATKTDRLLRVINTLLVEGKSKIATRDSRQASVVGSHWAAVQRYLQTGDDSALLKFKGKRVTDASGKRHLLLTDLKELDRLAAAGVLSFESMYAGGAR